MRVAIITCYKDPNYVRARTLRAGLAMLPNVKLIVIKNKHKGLLRYLEVILRIIGARLRHRPNAYLLTFRGYEILPFLLLLAWPKPVIFDELVNPIEVVTEHRRLHRGSIISQLMRLWTVFEGMYYFLLSRCEAILADTQSHAEYSHSLSKLPRSRFYVIPVGADETVFHLLAKPVKKTQGFQVFYYSNMLPLHGVEYVIQAALELRAKPSINFLLAGNNNLIKKQITYAQKQGAHITHKNWINFNKLPETAAAAGITLVGPFGNTLQSQLVVTGKTYQFLACGAPIIVGQTKVNGLFHDRVNCLVAAQGDSTALVNSILWAYEHQTELHKIGQNGRKLYEDKFSTPIIAQNLQLILDQVS